MQVENGPAGIRPAGAVRVPLLRQAVGRHQVGQLVQIAHQDDRPLQLGQAGSLLAQRAAAGKPEGGRITIAVAQAGNEVAVEIADDGAGLDLQRIRQRGFERGLIDPDQPFSEAELAQLIFSPGFSTADSVTELAGRGVGLDVVRAEVNAMGGRIETVSHPGQGTRFKLLLPLTTAVTQVVMLRCGEQQVAVPSTLIEVVRRVSATEVERAYAEGTIDHDGETLPFFWLAALLQSGTRGDSGERAQAVVIVRSAAQRVAVHVDEVVGNEEVVVKNVGALGELTGDLKGFRPVLCDAIPERK